jgi:hypothetical protein
MQSDNVARLLRSYRVGVADAADAEAVIDKTLRGPVEITIAALALVALVAWVAW